MRGARRRTDRRATIHAGEMRALARGGCLAALDREDDHERADAFRRDRGEPDGRRLRQGDHAADGAGQRLRADATGDARHDPGSSAGERGRAGGRPAGGDHGVQADGRPDPPVPPAGPRCGGALTDRRAAGDDPGRGPGQVGGPHGRRDGGDGRRERRLPDDLRHVQGRRPGHGDRRDPARGEERRPAGHIIGGPRRARRREAAGRRRRVIRRPWVERRARWAAERREGWDVVTNDAGNRRGPGPACVLADLYAADRRRAGRRRADLPGGAGQPLPVRATPGRPLRRLPGEAAAAGPGAARGPRLRAA